MRIALMAALGYWVMWCLDNITGVQALQRPMIMGTVIGALCGDITTGIIVGGTLEGIFLGAIGIGGTTPSDWRIATSVTTAYIIGSGLDLEAGLAIAAAIGVVANYFKQIGTLGSNAIQPIYDKLAAQGKHKQFRGLMYLDLFIFKAGINAVIIYAFVALGAGVLDGAMAAVPQWLLNGLTASSNLLVVVGLCLLARSIWQSSTPVFIILGFVLAKYVGLSMIAITAAGFVVAYCSFMINKKIEDTRKLQVNVSSSNEEDDFYA